MTGAQSEIPSSAQDQVCVRSTTYRILGQYELLQTLGERGMGV
ncbi:MAG TPA: hypothetical protein VNB06_12420 [Thermoanaerobaculia bacterium]|nr:hypothetical protein [Thermoanaerobaculia bacterium]